MLREETAWACEDSTEVWRCGMSAGGATGLMGCQGRGQTQEMAWDTVALKPAPRSWEPLAAFKGGVAWSACALEVCTGSIVKV